MGTFYRLKAKKNQRLSELTKGRFVVIRDGTEERVHTACSGALKRHQVKETGLRLFILISLSRLLSILSLVIGTSAP